MKTGHPDRGDEGQRLAGPGDDGHDGSDLPQVATPRVVLRLFAAARQAAGTGREVIDGGTVADVLAEARLRHGEPFGRVLDGSRVWVNGEPVQLDAHLTDGDEVAVLPPVSGGA